MNRVVKGFNRSKEFCFHLPFYHYSLRPSDLSKISLIPHSPWPGDAEIGNLLLQDIFNFEGQQQDLKTPNWWPDKASQSWLNYAHSFHWLRDLRETSGETARRKARELLLSWIAQNQHYNAFIWSADRVAKRIYNLISLYDFYASTADEGFIDQISSFVGKQLIHLRRIPMNYYKGNRLVIILRGLLFGMFNNPGLSKEIASIEKKLSEIVTDLVNLEGCHLSRNPTQHAELIRLLLDIKFLYQAAHRQMPVQLIGILKMMSPLLKFFTGSDEKLFLFHGGWEQNSIFLRCMQTYIDNRNKALKDYPMSGYHKVVSGKTALCVDASIPSSRPFDRWAHASSFAFELLNGKQRLIVNCGHPQDNQEEWDRLLAATAAHSTLVVEETNSAEILEKSIGKKPSSHQSHREDKKDETVLTMSHNGYQHNHGLLHHRMLALSKNGYVLRGEDCLEGEAGKNFTIRFHLHPKVKASMLQEGKAVLMQPPSGPGWRMDASGVEISIEPSIYYGNGKSILPTMQICLKGVTKSSSHHKTLIGWQFKTVPR